MSTRLQSLLGRTPRQRRTRFAALLAAVILVPLAVAGLVSGALGGAADRLETIPAVVVNDDEMVTTTTPDGAEQTVLAGRLLVTELTGDGGAGFDWTITNDEEAAEKLASGEAYAVLTIPSDFSKSITSLSGDAPTTADLSIRTDDAHGYLAGAVAQSVGTAMSATFGQAITAQYLEGFYTNLATLGGSLGDAADGAAELSSGAGSLADGIGQLSAGVAQAADGAADASAGAATYADGVGQFASGVDQYTSGVDGIASGLGQLATDTSELGQLGAGIVELSDGYAQLKPGLVGLVDQNIAAIAVATGQPGAGCATQPIPPQLANLCQLRSSVEGIGDGLSASVAGGARLGELQAGISQAAGGAAELSAGSAGLRDGANGLATGADQLAGGVSELASGLDQLSTGAADAASGATQLADGTTQLADGLGEGAEGASALTGIDAAETADVVSQPVSVDSARDNEIGSVGEVIGILFAPIGLWIGALAMFLVFRPITREVLRSTASTGGIVWRTLARASLVALAQTIAVVALLHVALGVSWTLLPQALAFGALMAVVFTALHAFLTTAFGRAGLLVSLVLLALQIAATGGLYPLEVVSEPFQAISPFLPMTWAVQGMQGIVAGVGGGVVGGAAAVLALFGLAGVLLTWAVLARRRGIRSTGFTAAALG
jgi:putative membrane protein